MIFKPCAHAGCPLGAEDESAYCATHRKQLSPIKWTRSIYRTALHKGWSSIVLRRDPICVACNRAPSSTADHVLPLEDGGTWELTNGQGLCTSCHSVKTAEDVKKRRLKQAGIICPPAMIAHRQILPNDHGGRGDST